MIAWNASIAGAFTAVDVSSADHTIGTNKKNSLYIGTGGDLVVIGKNDGDVETTFVGLAAGYHPIDCKKIISAGTTASDIIVLG